jgi:hypothetical protein
MIMSSGTLKIVNVWVRNVNLSLIEIQLCNQIAAKAQYNITGFGAPSLANVVCFANLAHYFDAGWLRPHT